MLAALAPPGVRILLVDDQSFFTEALRSVLGADDRLDVVGHAGDGEEAVRLVRTLRPDLVLMDVAMPRMDGIEATRRIRAIAPEVPVIILTSSTSDEDIERATEAGAAGYLTKTAAATDLISTAVEVTALAKAFSTPASAAVQSS